MNNKEKLMWLLGIIACPLVVLAMPKEEDEWRSNGTNGNVHIAGESGR